MIFLSACPSACTFIGITVFSTCLAAFLYCDFPFNIIFYAFCDGIVYHSFSVYLHRYSCLPVLLCVSSPLFLSTCPSEFIFNGIPVYLSICLFLRSIPIYLPFFLFLRSIPIYLPFFLFLRSVHVYICFCLFLRRVPVCLSFCMCLRSGPVYLSFCLSSQCSCLPVHLPILLPVPSQFPCLPVLLHGPVLLRLHLLLDFSSTYFTSARLIHCIACLLASFCMYLIRYSCLLVFLHLAASSICECYLLFYRRSHFTLSVTKLTDVLTDVITDVLTDV
jgi:hypothetical protein